MLPMRYPARLLPRIIRNKNTISQKVAYMIKKLFSKIKKDSRPERDFSLNSGERQSATALSGVRYDHRVRYDYAIEYIKNNCAHTNEMLGLDIFCATGYGTYMLTEFLRCPVMGVDASQEAIELANEHYSNSKTFFIHKSFPFELPKSTFNFITCIESLEHVDDAGMLLHQVNLSLKAGGYLFLSTPNERCYSLFKNPNIFHFKHFTKDELISIIKDNSDFNLMNWFGQNIYEMKDGGIIAVLPDEEMNLLEMTEGQILLYVFKKGL